MKAASWPIVPQKLQNPGRSRRQEAGRLAETVAAVQNSFKLDLFRFREQYRARPARERGRFKVGRGLGVSASSGGIATCSV